MPSWNGYFADPFVLRNTDNVYYAYGTNPEVLGERVFDVLESMDLVTWQHRGRALLRPDPALGEAYWAPEVAYERGRWWMYYSVGHDIAGHHLRVAVADAPTGPFTDLGVDLTPHERFAIDPHPFRDVDGRWYLYFARDVLETERPGTHLAVVPLENMTTLAAQPIEVMRPSADWQIYQRDRAMYGSRFTWHTLEGPSVVRRHGRYWLTYSGGAWTGDGYRVSWAVSDSPLGPWRAAPVTAPPLLQTGGDLIGPGHNSLTIAPDGSDVIAFHSWNTSRTRREFHLHDITFGEDGPSVDPVPRLTR